MQFFVWLCLILLPVRSLADQYHKDSLLSQARHDNDPQKRVDALLLLSDRYSSFYHDSALYYAGEGLKIAEKYNLTGAKVHAYYSFETIYVNSNNVIKAREYLAKGIKYSEQKNYIDGKIEGYMHYSRLCEILGKNDSMMYYSLNALELSKKSTNREIQAGVAHDIGNIYAYQGDFKKALYYCTLSLNIWKGIGHKNIAGILSDIGNIYFNKGDPYNALAWYRQAYENAQLTGDDLAFGYSLNNIGLVYLSLDSTEKAKKYFADALQYYNIDLNKEGVSNTENNLGDAYLKSGMYREALSHGKKSLGLAKEQNFKKGILGACQLLAEAESKLKNFPDAWRYQKLASLYQDTLAQLTINKKVADFETKFEMEKKDHENKLLLEKQVQQSLEIKRHAQLTFFIVIILVLCIIIAAIAVFSSLKRKKDLEQLAVLHEKITEQNLKLEETNELKNQLFSIISHDFKSPLASLNIFLTMLESGDFNEDEIKHISHELMARLGITFSFIDNLLGWAQSQLEGYKPVPVLSNIYEIAEDKFKLYRIQAEDKNISLHNNIDPSETIITDDNILRLVLRNLISNALKYTNNGGTITLFSDKKEKEVIISVSDTGVGISKAMLPKLFTSERINTTGTSNEPGTGLGLMLCREFIQRNGGKIWVESEPGKGSTFSFSIPL